MSHLARYRELSAAMHAAAVRVHTLERGAAREVALYEYQRLQAEAASMIRAWSASLGLYTDARMPKRGTLQEQMRALPMAARQAYHSKLRLDVAEADFAVHLLNWADNAHATDDAPSHSCSRPDLNVRKEGLPANDDSH